MGADADGDGVPGAARELRRVRDGELPVVAESVDQEIQDGIETVAGLVENAAGGDLARQLAGLAQEIRVLGTSMTAARADAFDAVAHAFAAEAEGLEALLRPADIDDGTPSPSLGAVAPAPHVPGLVLTGTVAEAEQLYAQRPQTDKAKHRPINQAVSRFPPKMQGLAKTLLFNRSSHAVERHGHHLTPQHQIARLQWRLDPAFADQWQRNDDGSVTSTRWNGEPHQVEEVAGHYTSPEAVVKPLVAILTVAGRTQHALDTYLNNRAGDETIVRLFLHPDTTGITADDVYTVRGCGSDTEPGKQLWLDTREGALNGHGSAPGAREYDQVTDGKRPGSLIVLAKGNSTNWRLITSFFTDDPDDLPYTEL